MESDGDSLSEPDPESETEARVKHANANNEKNSKSSTTPTWYSYDKMCFHFSLLSLAETEIYQHLEIVC